MARRGRKRRRGGGSRKMSRGKGVAKVARVPATVRL